MRFWQHETAKQKPGLWKRWKNKLRFSTVPTAPAAKDKNKKQSNQKQNPIVYTKYLTLPRALPPTFITLFALNSLPLAL
jgi:hypothetical protein